MDLARRKLTVQTHSMATRHRCDTPGVVCLMHQGMLPLGLQPIAYPVKRHWYSDFRKIGISHGNLEERFDQVVVGEGTFITYKESRLTRQQQRRLSMQERHHAERMIDEHGTKLPVLPDDEFRSEDGVRKAFRLFNSGEFLFHLHGGQEERMLVPRHLMVVFIVLDVTKHLESLQPIPWKVCIPLLKKKSTGAQNQTCTCLT